jgi:hypothetical protein
MTRPTVLVAAGHFVVELGLCFLAFLSPLSVLMVYCMMFFGLHCTCNWAWMTCCGQWALYTIVFVFWMSRWIKWLIESEHAEDNGPRFDPLLILVITLLYAIVRGIHFFIGIAKVKEENETWHFVFGGLSCVVSAVACLSGMLVTYAFVAIFAMSNDMLPAGDYEVDSLTWQLDVVRIFQTDGNVNQTSGTLPALGERAALFTEETYGPETADRSQAMAFYPSAAVIFGFVCCGLSVAHLKAAVQHCQLGMVMHSATANIPPPPPLVLRDNWGNFTPSRNYALESQENGYITDQVARAAKGGPAFNAAEYRATKLAFADSRNV